jgi:molybdenum cofactor biosynthesis enzyme
MGVFYHFQYRTMQPLTHFDAHGQAHMVDVADKSSHPPQGRGQRTH